MQNRLKAQQDEHREKIKQIRKKNELLDKIKEKKDYVLELEKQKLREINYLKQEDARENLMLHKNKTYEEKAQIIKKYLI